MNDASKMRWDDGVYGRRGCIDYAGDIDVFRLVATRAGQMRVRVRTFGRDNPLQPAFIVCDNLGGQTAQDVADAQDGRANANCQVAEGHAYFIAVTDAGDDAMGRYAVRARIRKHAAANGDDDDEEPEPEPEDLPAWVEPVDNSSALTGYVTHDIVIDTETDWLSAQMVVDLTAGTIYQDPFGTNISPNPLFFPTVPTLEFDTYVSNGTLGGSVSTTSAPDLDPGAPIQFDTSRISIGWFTTGTEIGELALARITLSDNAAGTWQFRATASPALGGPLVHITGTIANGVMTAD